MNVQFFKNLLKPLLPRFKRSYAQCGEDMILDFIFASLGIKKPTYLDIGAHHPDYLSNTALLYRHHGWGVNIEPDPNLFKAFERSRPRDVNLNIGVSENNGCTQSFYLMSSPLLNTFSKEEANRLEAEGKFKITAVKQITVEGINQILERYFSQTPPDLLSLDVEGLDFSILQALDFQKHAPFAICVETIKYEPNHFGAKQNDLVAFVCGKGYFVFADTYINTIFLHKERFQLLQS